jgi:hypothetical protein
MDGTVNCRYLGFYESFVGGANKPALAIAALEMWMPGLTLLA